MAIFIGKNKNCNDGEASSVKISTVSAVKPNGDAQRVKMSISSNLKHVQILIVWTVKQTGNSHS